MASLKPTLASETALAAFEAYVRAFETLDPAAVLRYYHEPCLLISPQGVTVLSSHAEANRLFAGLMADLRQRGFHRSRFENLAERRLSDILTLVTGIGTWRTTDGTTLQRFGGLYTWRKTDAWRIVTAVIHDPG